MTGPERKTTLPPERNQPRAPLPAGRASAARRRMKTEKPPHPDVRGDVLPPDGAKTPAALRRGQQNARVFGQNGIAMVRFTCRLPAQCPPEEAPDGLAAQWEDLFTRTKELAAEAETLCRTDLLSRMAKAYDADPDPRKRFRFKGADVTLTCDIADKGEGVFEVLWRFTITEAGESVAEETFCEHLFATLPPPSANSGQRRKKPPAVKQ